MGPHLTYAHRYWREFLHPGDCVIDATVGNGYDTFFLASLLKGQGRLIGYDIQQEAIENTKVRLEGLLENEKKIICLKKKSHALFEEKEVNLIVYNLGYLPGADKRVTTAVETTLQSVENGLKILAKRGAMSITCYPGHEEGGLEQAAIKNFLKTIPSSSWTVCFHQWINRPNAPTLIWLQRNSTSH